MKHMFSELRRVNYTDRKVVLVIANLRGEVTTSSDGFRIVVQYAEMAAPDPNALKQIAIGTRNNLSNCI